MTIHRGNVRDELIMNMLSFIWTLAVTSLGGVRRDDGALMGRSGSVSGSSLFPKKDFYSYLMYIIF